jgi:hypothetical protein
MNQKCTESRGQDGQHSVGWYYGGSCEWCGMVRYVRSLAEGATYVPGPENPQVRRRRRHRKRRRSLYEYTY